VKEYDDATLVQRSLEGDRAAFSELIVRYQRPVYNAALRLLHDAEEAKDVAQTTFLNVFEHLAKIIFAEHAALFGILQYVLQSL